MTKWCLAPESNTIITFLTSQTKACSLITLLLFDKLLDEVNHFCCWSAHVYCVATSLQKHYHLKLNHFWDWKVTDLLFSACSSKIRCPVVHQESCLGHITFAIIIHWLTNKSIQHTLMQDYWMFCINAECAAVHLLVTSSYYKHHNKAAAQVQPECDARWWLHQLMGSVASSGASQLSLSRGLLHCPAPDLLASPMNALLVCIVPKWL